MSRSGPRTRGHSASSADLAAVFPWQAGRPLLRQGTLVGRDVFGGGAFLYDTWMLYNARVITSPNKLVMGQLGSGKSSLGKTLVWRNRVFGRRAWVLDPSANREWTGLAEAMGCPPVDFRVGTGVVMNALGRYAGDVSGDATAAGRLEISRAVARWGLGRKLEPEEETIVQIALQHAVDHATRAQREPTFLDLAEIVWRPSEDLAAAVGYDTGAELRERSRPLAHGLRRAVSGEVGAMFSGQSTGGIDLDQPLVCFQLGGVQQEVLGIVMTCIFAALRRVLRETDDTDTVRRSLYVDEAWWPFREEASLAFIQKLWKDCRKLGIDIWAFLHRLSDLAAVGDAGSQAHAIAMGLLADTDTRVIYRQSESERENLERHLGMNTQGIDLIRVLRPGEALWQVGRAGQYVVQHIRTQAERDFADTDKRMAANPRELETSDRPGARSSTVA